MDFLLSVKGIGIVTASIIVAETNGFTGFTSIKQLTSYAGLDVRIRESGKWKGKSKISKHGNKYIRGALYMPSMSYKTHNKKARLFYDRINQRTGNGLIAIVAVERKLLGLMYSLWKKEEMFKEYD